MSDQAAWRVLGPRSPRADDKAEDATGQEERDTPFGCHDAESRESHVCGIFLCTKKKAITFMGF